MPYMKGALMYECVFDNFPNRVWMEQNNRASLPPETTQDRYIQYQTIQASFAVTRLLQA
jgi:hypothetical protein